MHKLDPETIGVRYRLESIIGAGGMGMVYLALDRFTGRKVALKRVKTALTDLRFSSKGKDEDNNTLALVREFRMLSSLRHPYIIDVLDYGFDEKKNPFYTMEFLETGIPIKGYAAFATKEEILDRVMEMLHVLVYLHRHGILHRDIKPSNIMVVDGHIKILDFGLAKSMQARSSEYSKDNLAGTMAYMAPELFSGDKVSHATDLYAVGLLAYELLSGQFPFKGNNLAHLAYEIINTSPDLTLLHDVDDNVIDVIDRLMVKNPDHRYQQASKAIQDLQQAIQKDLQENVLAIRDSFLQAARFVGRNHELKILREAMARAIDGKGSIWLVGGESGVGKTRLLEELRIRALVQGVPVWRGQVPAERQRLYHSWRDIARHLCLEVDLSDLEAQVLKLLVPDIDVLLERSVPDAPSIQPQAANERLLQVLEKVFRRLTRPVVIIFEDLHWSRESLLILKHLSQIVSEMPLMLIGSFRNDERPDLPEEILGANVLHLERLGLGAIRELSESMLGKIQQQDTLVDMLSRETEGNALFIVEVVRTLAEDVGQLDHIGRVTLPERVFSKGIQTVIQRRLEHLPPHAIYPLQLAAVAGREIDPLVLEQALPDYDWQSWFTICSDKTILVVEGYRWLFSHDKLREGVLEMLPDAEMRAVSTQIAEAIEAVYGKQGQYTGLLANLWRQAGNTKKEIQSLWGAATQLYEVSNIFELRQCLQRALELAEVETIDPLLRWKMEVKLAEAHALVSDLLTAVSMLEDLVESIPVSDNPDIMCIKSEVYYQLAFAFTNMGEYQQGLQFAQNGMELITGCPDLYQRTRILWIMAMANLFNTRYEEASGLYDECLALSLEINDTICIMSSYIGLASVAVMKNDFEQGIMYGEKAYTLASQCGNYLYQAYALHNQGALYVSAGYPEEGLECLEEAIILAKKLNTLPTFALARMNMALAKIMLDEFGEALAFLQEGLNLAVAVEGIPTALMGIGVYGRWMIRQGKREQAIILFVYVLAHPKTQMDDVTLFNMMLDEFEVTEDERVAANKIAGSLDFDEIVNEILAQ